MAGFLSLFQNRELVQAQNEYIAGELLALNSVVNMHGLTLSETECMEIAKARTEALIENERIEIGVGAVQAIIERFCDSGYINQSNFSDTIQALTECFYSIKTETFDKITDEEALDFLVYLYEEKCGGDHTKLYMSEAYDLFIAKALSDNLYRNASGGLDGECAAHDDN